MAESLKFGAVSYGDSMTVEGLSYRVREGPLKLGDGAFCAILLEQIEAAANRLTTLAGDALVTLDGRYLVTL
jgi:hypothetical protein